MAKTGVTRLVKRGDLYIYLNIIEAIGLEIARGGSTSAEPRTLALNHCMFLKSNTNFD